MTWEQLQSTKRKGYDIVLRATQLDQIVYAENYLRLEFVIESDLYDPFKPNVMTHLLPLLLACPMMEWKDKNVTRYFNSEYIRDTKGYEWFLQNKLLEDDFSLRINAIKYDSLELYLMNTSEPTYDIIECLIRARAFTILRWVLKTQTITVPIEFLFHDLIARHPPHDLVVLFPKPSLIRIPQLRNKSLSLESLQYLMTHFTLDATGLEIAYELLSNIHRHMVIKYMQWKGIDPTQFVWTFHKLNLDSIQLLYEMNPDVLKVDISGFGQPKETLFLLQHGATCDLEYLMSVHRDLKPKWSKRLISCFPFPLQITRKMKKYCTINIEFAKWFIDGALTNNDHLNDAFQFASQHKLYDKIEQLVPKLPLDNSLLSSIYDPSVLRVVMERHGAVAILDIALQNYDALRLMSKVFTTQRPVFDEAFINLLKDNQYLVTDLGLFYSWPQDVMAMMSKTKENNVLLRLYALHK